MIGHVLQSPTVIDKQQRQAAEVVQRNGYREFPSLLARSFLHEVGDLPIGLECNLVHGTSPPKNRSGKNHVTLAHVLRSRRKNFSESRWFFEKGRDASGALDEVV